MKYTGEEICEYLKQWYDEEYDRPFNQILDMSSIVGIEYACSSMASTGAIDPELSDDPEIEKEILIHARNFEKLSKEEQQDYVNKTFKDTKWVECDVCNFTQSVTDINYKIYEKQHEKCWKCESPTTVTNFEEK